MPQQRLGPSRSGLSGQRLVAAYAALLLLGVCATSALAVDIRNLLDDRQQHKMPTIIAGRDGHLGVARRNGVRRVDSLQVATQEAPPHPHIVSVRADDSDPRLAKDATLPPLTQKIAIAYTATGPKYPENLVFRYRLIGSGHQWEGSGTAREVSYFGLSPGEYFFELEAAYGGGIWSKPTSTAFVVQPALHQTKGFIVTCALAACLVLTLVYQLRVRHLTAALRIRLEEPNLERERLARELHDTLLQSVQGLMFRFQAAARYLPESEAARREIESALDQADEVMVEARDRITRLRLREPRSGELLQALVTAGHELAEVHGVRFRSIAQGKLWPLGVSIEVEIFRIAREALINAFRHASANEVELEMTSDRSGLRLRVRDNGKGIPLTVLQRRGCCGHWGLAGMRERAEKIGARFELWSQDGAGTEIEIFLPRKGGQKKNTVRRGWRRWLIP